MSSEHIYFNSSFDFRDSLPKMYEEGTIAFTYGQASFEKFLEQNLLKNETTKGFYGRKLTALPQAFWSGIILTTYHLALALLVTLPSLVSLNLRPIKANVYSAARDVEQAVGHIISLFDDNWGGYLVQEAIFQKDCYQSNHSLLYCKEDELAKAKNFSLKEFSTRSFLEKWFLYQQKMPLYVEGESNFKFNLLVTQAPYFFNRLNTFEEDILEKFSYCAVDTHEFNLAILNKKIEKYTSLSKEDFAMLKVHEIQETDSAVLEAIKMRLTTLSLPPAPLSLAMDQLTLGQLSTVHVPSDLKDLTPRFPSIAFTLLADDQIPHLDFQRITEEQLSCLFKLYPFTSHAEGIKLEKRVALLPTGTMQTLIRRNNSTLENVYFDLPSCLCQLIRMSETYVNE